MELDIFGASVKMGKLDLTVAQREHDGCTQVQISKSYPHLYWPYITVLVFLYRYHFLWHSSMCESTIRVIHMTDEKFRLAGVAVMTEIDLTT